MHYTRRLLERRYSSVFVIVGSLIAGTLGASCSISDAGQVPGAHDAASDGSGEVADASAADATPEGDGAPPFDGGPRPVVCASTSCATKLVTTRGKLVKKGGHVASDFTEGFCALLHDGTVACWGAGGAGQLGRGDDAGTADDATPARVVGLTDIVELDHTCAVDKAGAVFCWGTGPFVRDPSLVNTTEPTPVKVDIPRATKVAVGAAAACALADGNVFCWGGNLHGQLAPLETEPPSAVLTPRAIELPHGAPLRDLLVGDAVFAVRDDGTFVTWGANPPLARVSSLFPDPHPEPSALAGVSMLDIADDNACAAAGGTAYCWGTVTPGPSDPSTSEPRVDRALPAPVVTPEPVVQIATTRTLVERADYSPPVTRRAQRWCAVGASGAVYCWGYNAGGQAGDGTKDYAYEAVKVVNLPAPAAQVKATPEATCALLTTGKIYCWGTNYYGQLGNGNIRVASLTPQEAVLP